jgi:hypothetical protein
MRELDSTPAPAGRPARQPSRLTRSRLAKPLLTSLGAATMVVASAFVVVAVSSTGSARPWDWTRADPSAAAGRYSACGQQGLGAIGCMLTAAFRPAAASGASHKSMRPLLSTATVQDASQPSAQSGRTAAAKPPTAAHAAAPSAPARRVGVAPTASASDVIAACQAAMRAAQTQGTAAMGQVESECEDALRSRCPVAMATPRTQGAAAIQELEDECAAPRPTASPGRDDD